MPTRRQISVFLMIYSFGTISRHQTLNNEGRQKSCVRINKQVQDFPSIPFPTGYPLIPFSIRARWVQSSLWVTFCYRKFLFSLSKAPDAKSRMEALIRLDTGSTSVHLRVNICLSTLKEHKVYLQSSLFLDDFRQ